MGPIVRQSARAPGPAGACRAAWGLETNRPTLLVTGGSQGARPINDLMVALMREHPDALEGWQVIHQTGPGQEEALREAYARRGVPARVEAFLTDMGRAWGAADLTLSRSGAGSVAEAWANGVPAIFLPYPHHRDEHQRLNARALEEAGAAVVVTDHVDATANLREAGEELRRLLRDGAARERMRESLRRLGPVEGARRVAEMLHADP